MCSHAIFETCFSYDKHIWITATDYYTHLHALLHNCAFSINSYSPINKFYLLHFLSFRCYFLYLNIIWSLTTDTALKVSQSLYCFTISIFHGVKNYFPRLWGMGISDAFFFSFTII